MSQETIITIIAIIIFAIVLGVAIRILQIIFDTIINAIVNLILAPFRWIKRRVFKIDDTEVYNVNIVNKKEGE